MPRSRNILPFFGILSLCSACTSLDLPAISPTPNEPPSRYRAEKNYCTHLATETSPHGPLPSIQLSYANCMRSLGYTVNGQTIYSTSEPNPQTTSNHDQYLIPPPSDTTADTSLNYPYQVNSGPPAPPDYSDGVSGDTIDEHSSQQSIATPDFLTPEQQQRLYSEGWASIKSAAMTCGVQYYLSSTQFSVSHCMAENWATNMIQYVGKDIISAVCHDPSILRTTFPNYISERDQDLIVNYLPCSYLN
jgi:hypothetical protein